MTETDHSTHDPEGTAMTERQALLDFPGADALRAAGRVDPPSPQALARAMAAVQAAARDEAAPDQAVVIPIRRRRLAFGRRIVATALVAAAVAAGVVLTGNTGTQAGSPGPAASQQPQAGTAATFLDSVAEVAAAQPAGTGAYWKMDLRSPVWNGGGRQTYTEYISRDMKYTIVQGGKTYEKQAGAWGLGPKTLDWDGLDQLPTDPAKLLSLMQSSPEYTGPSVFLQVGSLLGGSPASPKLRAALYQSLGHVEGVKVVGTVQDSTGRTGTKLVISNSGKVDSMIIDPKTAMLLETSATAAKPGEAAELVTYLSVGLADKIG